MFQKTGVSRTASSGFLTLCQNLEKANDSIQKIRPDRQMDRSMDRS